MYGVMLALLPALLVSFFYFGIGSVIVCATSVIACVAIEWAINKFLLKNPRNTILDGSAALTGLLLGMNLPSNLPIWIIVIGALFAIGIAKMSFGGLGQNIFNPALVGRCALLVAFPAQMTTWPVAGQWMSYTDALTGATPLSIMKQAIKSGDVTTLQQLPDAFSLLIGENTMGGAGTIGEICGLALLAGFAFMLWRKIITWHIPVAIIGTVFVFSTLLHLANPIYADPTTVILTGGLMLGAIFMATDYVTSPMTANGQLVYGVCIGLLTVIIRNWGAYPEGMSFAILIMNAFTPLINNYMKPKRFGETPSTK
jgi:electron transport complex protein RnfD